jgi:hypothetical protein
MACSHNYILYHTHDHNLQIFALRWPNIFVFCQGPEGLCLAQENPWRTPPAQLAARANVTKRTRQEAETP